MDNLKTQEITENKVAETTGAHSMLGPSSAVRRLQCPASLMAEKNHIELFGEEESDYSTEGTYAHEALEIWINECEADAIKYMKEKFGKHSWKEHRDNLIDAVQFVEEHLEKGYAVEMEARYDLTHLHPTCFGTADITLLHEKIKHLVIGDFKYGAGVLVEADYGSFDRVKEKSILGVDGNVQALMYASGALKRLGLSDAEILDWTIDLVIIQPRREEDTIRTTTVSGFELVYAQDYITDKFSNLTDPEVEHPYKIGSHCQFCSARPTCPAQAKRVLDAFESIETLNPQVQDMVENNTDPTLLDDLQTQRLKKELTKLRTLWNMKQNCLGFFNQLEKFLLTLIQKGMGEDLGLELKPGRGRRAYPDSIKAPEDLAEVLSQLGLMINAEQVTTKSVLPFTKVMNMIDKKDRHILEDLLIQKPGSPKIVESFEGGGDMLLDFGDVEIID